MDVTILNKGELMSHTDLLSPVETQLSPLQREIYTFLTTTSKSSVKRQELMLQLNCHHQGSLTRSLNQLAKQRLIQLISSSDDLIIELVPKSSTPTSDAAVQLSLLPDESSTSTPSTDQPFQEEVTLESNANLHTSEVSPIKERPETPSSEGVLTEELHPKKEITEKTEAANHCKDILASIKETIQEEITITPSSEAEPSASNDQPASSDVEPSQSSSVSDRSQPSLMSYILSPETIPSKKPSFVVEVDPPKPSTTPSPKLTQVTQPEWVQTFQTLNKPTKKLMRTLLKACLKQKTWFLTNYPSHLTKDELKETALPIRLNNLIETGFIQLSGAKKCRVTFQHSPLELCKELPNYQEFYRQQPNVLKQIHSDYQAALNPSPKSSTPAAPSSKTTSSLAKPALSLASMLPKPELLPSFEKRYYLLDSENCHQFLTSPQFLKQLNPSDRFIIFLSQNSPSTHPTVLHFIYTHKDQIEIRYVMVRGKGESDLDHVLTMELAYLWTQDPHAQYIILSKDQGFLASVNYWTQRHQLKPHQLCLKTALI